MKLQVFIALTVACILVNAQTFNVTEGTIFKSKKDPWTHHLFEPDSTAFYTLDGLGGYYSTRYVLRKFDAKNAQLVYEKFMDFSGEDYLGGKSYFLHGFRKGGKILVFSQSTKLKTTLLMMHEYSCETGEALRKPLVVQEIADTKAYIVSDGLQKFEICFSPDNTKMLIVAELKRNQKIQKVVANLYQVSNYKKIWEKEPLGTYLNSSTSTSNYVVDNQGNFSYIFAYLKSNRELVGGSQDVAHAIGMSNANSLEHKVVQILSTEFTTKDPQLEMINNVLVCSGKYFGEYQAGQAFGGDKKVGFYLLTLDPGRGVLLSQSANYFKPDIHKKLSYLDKGFTTLYAGSKHYYHYKTLSHKGSFYQIWTREIDHDYESEQGMEILVYKYTTSHQLEWMKLIPRRTGKEMVAMNYFPGKSIHLLYYEDPSNLENYPNTDDYDPRKYKKSASLKKSVLVYLSIDEKGKVDRKTVPLEANNRTLEPQHYDNVLLKTKNTLVVPAKVSSSTRRFDLFQINE